MGNSTIVYSTNICKDTQLPYEILIDEEDLPKIEGRELIVVTKAGTRTYLSVVYRKFPDGRNATCVVLSRLITGVENISHLKITIHFENDNHLDLRRKNMKLMTPGDYRKQVLEKKHCRSLSLQFSTRTSC